MPTKNPPKKFHLTNPVRKFVIHLANQRVSGQFTSTPVAGPFGVTAYTVNGSNFIYLMVDSKRKNIDPSYIIASLAHEYGHILNFRHGYSKSHILSRSDKIAYAYYEYKNISKKGKSKFYNEEKAAWTRAEATLKRYGFKDWTAFNELKSWALSTYRKTLWKLR
jgi:hypothetical protein